jgi:soluble lytic murein transglycosylase-like protein
MKIAPLIIEASKKTGIAPSLLASVIHQESRGEIYAVRFEPLFFDKYVKGKTKKTSIGHIPSMCSWATEQNLRAHSFGLFQMMGQVARERGFKGEFLTELLDPATNIKLGSEFLQTLLLKYEDTEKALLRWNGGGNPEYGKEVLSHVSSGAFHYLLCS